MNYKSDEEIYFAAWLDELVEKKVVKYYCYEGVTFPLTDKQNIPFTKKMKTKEKVVLKMLLNGMTYTPDFIIHWNPKFVDIVANKLCQDLSNVKCILPILFCQDYVSYVDTKGEFNKHNLQTFEAKRKILYKQERIFINKLVPWTSKKNTGLFNMTFTPKRFIEEHARKKQKNHRNELKKFVTWDIITIGEYLRGVSP